LCLRKRIDSFLTTLSSNSKQKIKKQKILHQVSTGGFEMGFNTIEIEIMNWREYNPRRELKKPGWFRLEHSLFENPDFYSFSHIEKLVWIYLLSMACKKNSGQVIVNFEHAERVAQFKSKDIVSAIEKLEQNQCVVVIRNEDVTSTLRGRDVTNETNETNETKRIYAQNEFERLYQLYPRKLGKQEGLKKLKTHLKTPDDIQLFGSALTRFLKYHSDKGTDPQYIPYFSTFVSSWRDWIEEDTGKEVKLVDQEQIKKQEALRVVDEELRKYEEEFYGKPFPDRST
jgi:hypothetical protein